MVLHLICTYCAAIQLSCTSREPAIGLLQLVTFEAATRVVISAVTAAGVSHMEF